MNLEYGPDIRYGRVFGRGTFLGNVAAFFDKDPQQQLLILGWSHACPDPEAIAKEYGGDWTLRRYAECNFWSGYIFERGKSLNPPLAEQLLTPLPRQRGESAGSHDPRAVPESHLYQMSPLSTPWGYALPRVLIEQFGTGEARTQKRMLKGLRLIDRVVRESSSPAELLARLANEVIKADANKTAVLAQVLAANLEKEGCGSALVEVAQELKKRSPRLWQHYEALDPSERQKLGMIAEFPLGLNPTDPSRYSQEMY